MRWLRRILLSSTSTVQFLSRLSTTQGVCVWVWAGADNVQPESSLSLLTHVNLGNLKGTVGLTSTKAQEIKLSRMAKCILKTLKQQIKIQWHNKMSHNIPTCQQRLTWRKYEHQCRYVLNSMWNTVTFSYTKLDTLCLCGCLKPRNSWEGKG